MISKAGNQTKIFLFDGQMEYVGLMMKFASEGSNPICIYIDDISLEVIK